MINIRRKLWLHFIRVVPRSVSGDFVISWLKFVWAHRRFPDYSSSLFNDVLFRVKSTREVEDPLRVFVTDKEYFKLFVKSIVGEKYVVPTIGVLRNKSDVDSYIFPNNCCIKPTHMSGKVIIVKNALPSRDEIKSWFDLSHYAISRERNYRLLQPKVIIEPIIFGESDLTDFRIFCMKGVAKLICLDIGKYTNYSRAFYSLDWVKQYYSLGYPLYEGDVDRPKNLEAMIRVAQELSMGFGFIRVDFYTDGRDFYVGELTNCHASASQRFIPLDAEEIASNMIFQR